MGTTYIMNTAIQINAERPPVGNAVNDSFIKAAEAMRVAQLRVTSDELRGLCEDVITRSDCPLLASKARTLLTQLNKRQGKC